MAIELSIITVCYNSKNVIKKTMDSILNQTCNQEDIEYIIVDGCSEDGTVDIIKDYEEKFTCEYYWSSEKDEGIYDAMNKGISKAKGRYLLFLNAGDYLYDETIIESVIKCEEDVVYGNILIENSGELCVKKYPSKLYKEYFFIDLICHQAIFISKKIFGQEGNYNKHEKIYAYFEHLYSVYLTKKYTWKHIDQIATVYNLDGISSTNSKMERVKHKLKFIYSKYGVLDAIYFVAYWISIKPVYVVKSKIRKIK